MVMEIRTKILLIFVLSLIGCSGSGMLSVKTNPSVATVKLSDESGEIREIGNTPLSVNFNEVFAGSKNIKVIIEKGNFESEKIILTRPEIKTDYNLSVDLKRDRSAESQIENLKTLEKVAKNIAEVLKKIQERRFKDAEDQLLRFIEEYPSISVSYDLLGNVYYMMGDRQAARAQYLKADSINPNNFERKRIIQRLSSEM
jgi:tetratricopeptide (TPR) repeat protein